MVDWVVKEWCGGHTDYLHGDWKVRRTRSQYWDRMKRKTFSGTFYSIHHGKETVLFSTESGTRFKSIKAVLKYAESLMEGRE